MLQFPSLMTEIFTKQNSTKNIGKQLWQEYKPYNLRENSWLLSLQNTVSLSVRSELIKIKPALEHKANLIKFYKVKSFKWITMNLIRFQKEEETWKPHKCF